MTPAQRKYDIELARSMREMAVFVSTRSRKVADALNTGADRIDALTMQVEVTEVQPASTPDQIATTGPNEQNALDRRKASLKR